GPGLPPACGRSSSSWWPCRSGSTWSIRELLRRRNRHCRIEACQTCGVDGAAIECVDTSRHGRGSSMMRAAKNWSRGVGLLAMTVACGAASAMAAELPSYVDDNGNELRPTLKLESAFFPQSQSWFGESKANLGHKSDYWFEEAATFGVNGVLSLDGY